MTMKVYGGCYDGRNRVIVAAKTKRAAYALVSAALRGISYYGWNEYTSETGNDPELSVALAQPETVFSAPMSNDKQFASLSPSPSR